MKIRILLIAGLALAMAAPAFAVVKNYNIRGDNSTLFPTSGVIFRTGAIYGSTEVDEDVPSVGSTTLNSLEFTTQFEDNVGATTTTGVPGSRVILRTKTTQTVPGGQVGTGDTSTSITWGNLSGFSQTGFLFCQTVCPSGLTCPSSCNMFGIPEGTGPPAPLNGAVFNPGPWDFTSPPPGKAFTGPGFEQINLGGGAVLASSALGGFEPTVPVLPLAAFGGLGAGLVFLGTRALRRKDS
jgi:hypothetical protein